MDEKTKDVLELMRSGTNCVNNANYLALVILNLEAEIDKLKGENGEQESKVNIEVLCTCRDGSCSSLLSERQ